MKPKLVTLLGAGLALLLHLLPAWKQGWNLSPAPATSFTSAVPVFEPGSSNSIFKTSPIDPNPPQANVHASSLCELPGDRLGAVWYAGTREGARDVCIYYATRSAGPEGAWSPARMIMSQEQARKDLNKSIRKVGNAVLFSEASGKLWLVYVTVGFGGWAGASLNVTHSADLGVTWSRSESLPTSPFFNVSTLVRNNPVALQDGGWAVPTYHEFLGKFPEILWLKETGDGVQFSKTRITGGLSAFQPALVALSSREAIMLCRDTGGTRRIHLGRSVDAGRTWTTPKLLDLPNSNSGLCALRLTDGSVLLAFNDTLKARDNLSLALSKDGGNSWKRAAVIENTPGQGFSYPCLVQTHDGLIHLSYSRNRDVIQYACFNRAWLESQEVVAAPRPYLEVAR